jgi:hypothetical protein
MASNKYREVDIESITENDAFEAWGYVHLKVVRGDEVLGVRVKICSVPQETIDDLRKKAPRPPSVTKMLDPNTPEAQAMGITQRQKAILPDYNDPEYVKAQEDFDLMFRREIVGRGVKSNLTMKNGTAAQTPEERYRALEEKGISGIHFGEIAQQIMALTTWTEDERTNFLKPSSASGQAS